MSTDDDSNLLVDLVIANLFDKIDDKDENSIPMARTKSEKPSGDKHLKQKKAISKEEGKRIAEENELRHQEKLRIQADREKAQKANKATKTGEDAGESFSIDAGGADESTSKKDPVPLILYVKYPFLFDTFYSSRALRHVTRKPYGDSASWLETCEDIY
jgi:hypothetical protein